MNTKFICFDATTKARNSFFSVGDTVYIELNNGTFVAVDADDFPWVAHLRWSADGLGYAQTRFYHDGKLMHPRLHRFLMGAEASGRTVDHKNGCRWDCRRTNLRICSREQNNQNRGVNTANRIGYKGVRQHPSSKTYFVQIKKNGQTVRVGKFDSPEEAARGYDFLARSFFGEFARLNFNDDQENPRKQ